MLMIAPAPCPYLPLYYIIAYIFLVHSPSLHSTWPTRRNLNQAPNIGQRSEGAWISFKRLSVDNHQ